MASRPVRKQRSQYAAEEDWLREYATFYGYQSVTRFSEEDLGDLSLVEVLQVLARPDEIVCDKCDGPGTRCLLEAQIEGKGRAAVTVHFESQSVQVTIERARTLEEHASDEPDAA